MEDNKKYEGLIEKEEELKEILKNSLPGTLAHNQSRFYLSVIENIKKSKNSKLSDNDLGDVAGGTNFKNRFLASFAAFLSLVSANPAAFAEGTAAELQSNSIASYKKSQTDEYEEILDKVRNMSDEEAKKELKLISEALHEEYTEEFLAASFMIFENEFEQSTDLSEDRKTLAAYIHFNAFIKKYPEFFENLGEMKELYDLSDDEIQNKINAEKDRFIKLGTIDGVEYFKIEKNIEKSTDPQFFLLTLRKINNILEKYSKFTSKIASLSKQEHSVFKIHSFEPNEENKFTNGALMYVFNIYHTKKNQNTRLLNIFISKALLNNFRRTLSESFISTLTGFRCYVEGSNLVSGLAAHEMGHVFEYLMHLMTDKIFPSAFISVDTFAQAIKKQITNIAKEKYGATDSKISQYGETDAKEWFAEVFANLECANEENISPYGKAMRDVLKMFEDETINKEELHKNIDDILFSSKT